ncbi:MAG: YitT family protein, partial [Oscillospiraceae bacterium]|nr:YitT family protein [Oscillospiraceae bacterium]
ILANIIVDFLSAKTGKNYSLTYILLGFNACVYMAAFLVINQNAALLSLLVYVVATSIITSITDHFDAVKQVTIITKEPDNIVKDIKAELNKTCTIMNSYGVIAGENKTVICYVSYFELQKMKEIIARNKGSFSTVTTVDEILR